ncbi:MAG: 2-amino-4-hydroxy-6-hydroxymethyldihydropteridine diphosphokinase [Halobacteriovoraceae bacterium]|nr:2-amino-4-hydroxy-6-hydroxymethyldihydropteridine diphosphokinase [Halobacteriovoraceae bacterium]|tara:strand:+ start:6406 stop:6864 length:459 start_codon:yes stop_codon:yes gene_type:complete
MSLIIATGSNLGNKIDYLTEARLKLQKLFELVEQSRVFSSPAVDYENQPDFYNQLLEFKIPQMPAHDVIKLCLDIEKTMGRIREIKRGPRNIDIDIIFWGLDTINLPELTVPHPRWSERSFIVLPLQELPYFETLAKHYKIPTNFENTASPI